MIRRDWQRSSITQSYNCEKIFTAKAVKEVGFGLLGCIVIVPMSLLGVWVLFIWSGFLEYVCTEVLIKDAHLVVIGVVLIIAVIRTILNWAQ